MGDRSPKRGTRGVCVFAETGSESRRPSARTRTVSRYPKLCPGGDDTTCMDSRTSRERRHSRDVREPTGRCRGSGFKSSHRAKSPWQTRAREWHVPKFRCILRRSEGSRLGRQSSDSPHTRREQRCGSSLNSPRCVSASKSRCISATADNTTLIRGIPGFSGCPWLRRQSCFAAHSPGARVRVSLRAVG